MAASPSRHGAERCCTNLPAQRCPTRSMPRVCQQQMGPVAQAAERALSITVLSVQRQMLAAISNSACLGSKPDLDATRERQGCCHPTALGHLLTCCKQKTRMGGMGCSFFFFYIHPEHCVSDDYLISGGVR